MYLKLHSLWISTVFLAIILCTGCGGSGSNNSAGPQKSKDPATTKGPSMPKDLPTTGTSKGDKK